MGRLRQTTEEIQNLLDKVEQGEISAATDWNANLGEIGYIKGRSHRINGASPIPFEGWSKRFDEDGNAIYFQTLPPNNYSGCLIREGFLQEENYIFFGTEWKSLTPAVSADIRINYDSDSGDTVLEIKLYRESDPESFLATFINNALFAYGFSEDFICPIANEFIPDTIARTNDVEEVREETVALWENLDHGTFPNLVAGDLAGRGESVPAEFGFRASGGKSIKDGRAYIKRIKGNSVVWNQWKEKDKWVAKGGTITYADGIYTFTPNGSDSYSGIRQDANIGVAGHRYLLLYSIYVEGSTITGYNVFGNSDGKVITSDAWNYVPMFFTCKESPNRNGIIYAQGTPTKILFKDDILLIDLTKMFGAGNEPTTIEDFYARVATLGIDMNAYKEGQVIHCNTESIKSVGDNAWDEQWEFGSIYGASTDRIRSKNLIRVIGGETYYFYCSSSLGSYFDVAELDAKGNMLMTYGVYYNRTKEISKDAHYIKIGITPAYGTTYKNDITISLYHSGWKAEVDNTYKPYWQDTLPLPIISKYFPDGMKSAGSAHDEIRFNKESGKWEKVQRIGVRAYQEGDADKTDVLTDGKTTTLYELAEPIVTELDAEDQNFRDYYNVADFGTEQSQSSVPSANFSADIIYQFNAVDMIREHEIEITELQNVIAIMQAQLTSLINGGQ